MIINIGGAARPLEFNEDGTKVCNVVEFCDMDTLRRMVGKVYTQEENEKGLMESF